MGKQKQSIGRLLYYNLVGEKQQRLLTNLIYNDHSRSASATLT